MAHDTFTAQYIKTALFLETDGPRDTPLDQNYTAEDIAPEALARMQADCAKFQADNGHMFEGRESDAGYDFWLTRNGHGAGFWETDDWPDFSAELDAAATAFGECNLYVGDDGRIYHFPV